MNRQRGERRVNSMLSSKRWQLRLMQQENIWELWEGAGRGSPVALGSSAEGNAGRTASMGVSALPWSDLVLEPLGHPYFPFTYGMGHSLPALPFPLFPYPFIQENTGYFRAQCFATVEQGLCTTNAFLEVVSRWTLINPGHDESFALGA